jgi:signal transduction histidine kinase
MPGTLGSSRKWISAAIARVVLPYVFFAGLWVLLSDRMLESLVADPAVRIEWSIYKGWAFVIVTALLLAVLMHREILDRERKQSEGHRADEEIRRLHEELQQHATQLEQRVARRTAELAVARDRAESADRLKSAFLATMSHELRTPLNSILGFTGIALQGMAGPLNDEQRKQLGMVRDSARHLLALINDVLDISKIEAGELKVHVEPFDLRKVIERAVDSVRPYAESKGLALRATIDPRIGPSVSDTRRVEQILLNLLNNAIKFTERGEVSLTATAEEDRVHIAVTDTGMGIAPENIEVVFRPFQQLDSGLSRSHEGTGLGLAICRRLAELLGGEIRATSECGVGSVFTVTLPGQGKGG